MTEAEIALEKIDAHDHSFWSRRIRLSLVAFGVIAFYAASWVLAKVDLGKLVTGLPKLWFWLAQAWPPVWEEVPLFLLRIGETIDGSHRHHFRNCLGAAHVNSRQP